METEMEMKMVAIRGNTYPVKDAIKALGGRWSPDEKAWMVPDAKAAEAQALVSGAPQSTPTATADKGRYRPTRCAECGARAGRYTRIYGYSDRTAKCGPCFGDEREEREMGY